MIYEVKEIKDSLASFGMMKVPAKKAILQSNSSIAEVVIERTNFKFNNFNRYEGQCPRNDWVRVGMKVKLYHDPDGDYVVKYNRKEEKV